MRAGNIFTEREIDLHVNNYIVVALPCEVMYAMEENCHYVTTI